MSADTGTADREADHEDNYFVSMTDMMVGVLFIFIIMLMVFALDFRSKTDVQVDAINVAREVAKKLEVLREQVSAEISVLDEAQRTRRQLLADLRDQLKAQGLNVQIDEANGVLRLTEDAVLFEPNDSRLPDRARQNVAKIAGVLDVVLPRYARCRSIDDRVSCSGATGSSVETVFIEGHTDVTGVREPGERDRRNWQLSTERAVNTYREIIAQAPALRALRNSRREEIVSVSGYSSTRPIDPADTRESWAKNRRIDLRFVMEIDSRQRLEEILKLTDEMKRQIERLEKASGG